MKSALRNTRTSTLYLIFRIKNLNKFEQGQKILELQKISKRKDKRKRKILSSMSETKRLHQERKMSYLGISCATELKNEPHQVVSTLEPFYLCKLKKCDQIYSRLCNVFISSDVTTFFEFNIMAKRNKTR